MPGLRKTLRRIEHPGHARYLTFSCYHRLPLFGNDLIKDTFAESLAAAVNDVRFELYAWVVMPEHVHLLLRPVSSELTVETILRRLKTPFAQSVIARWRELDAPILSRLTDRAGRVRFWQPGGGYDRNIHADDELIEKIEYIHDNPVRRGLVATQLGYRWSSARWHDGDQTWGPRLTTIG